MVIITHENEFVNVVNSKSEIENRKCNDQSHVPLEGSAASIVARQKEARVRKSEQLMDDMSEDFPQLKNIYEILKKKG